MAAVVMGNLRIASYLPGHLVAKTRQRSFELLPLSDAFYARLSHTAARHGLGRPDDDALARAVQALSHAYTRERDSIQPRSSNKEAHAARAHFFLPRDLAKVLGPVGDLRRLGRLPAAPRLRVLDIGAGLGATSLGLARALAGEQRELAVTAVERDAGALAFFRDLSTETNRLGDEFATIELDARSGALGKLPDGPFDVVLLGFVLNELFAEQGDEARIAARAELLVALAGRLAPGGVIIALEPALKEVTRALMAVRDVLAARAGAPFVLAPCVRKGPCPMLEGERDWCHEHLSLALPQSLVKVARGAGLRWEGLSYAALVLGDAPRASEPGLVRIVSERLESKGKLELYGCGEQGIQRFSLLTRDESDANRAFSEARRGHELAIESEARLGRETPVKRR
jgi:SAM-dependent methyltransferase